MYIYDHRSYRCYLSMIIDKSSVTNACTPTPAQASRIIHVDEILKLINVIIYDIQDLMQTAMRPRSIILLKAIAIMNLRQICNPFPFTTVPPSSDMKYYYYYYYYCYYCCCNDVDISTSSIQTLQFQRRNYYLHLIHTKPIKNFENWDIAWELWNSGYFTHVVNQSYFT
jgi:hypothetical protein